MSPDCPFPRLFFLGRHNYVRTQADLSFPILSNIRAGDHRFASRKPSGAPYACQDSIRSAGHHDFRYLIAGLTVIGDTCAFPLADRPAVLSLVALASDGQGLTVRGQHRTPEARPPRYRCSVAGKGIQ
jgi:hypothetical protein